MVEIKQNNFIELFLWSSGAIDDADFVSPTYSLRDPTTQDTDKSEIQHVSEHESVYSCALS